MRRAFITGITGQDGSYLTELLLSKGYEVHGIMRRSPLFYTGRIDYLYRDPHDPQRRVFLHYGDLADGTGLRRVLEAVQTDEVYNLGAQSHVMVSFDQPEYTADVDALGALRLLEAVRDYQSRTRRVVQFYQAGSSEMFGAAPEIPQRETTPFHPRSPYGVAKVFAHWQTRAYREAYGMFAVNGILFNHESPRRGETFVSRKITRAATRIKRGLQQRLFLGNLEAKRDWGYAGDYGEAMWSMLQQPVPGDYVIATGESHSVKEFCERAFGLLDLDWSDFVAVDPRYFRPAEVHSLQGDPSKARRELGWQPRVLFPEYDLTHPADAERLFRDAAPQMVIHLAARVGGIEVNRVNPGRFFHDNMAMGFHVVEAARRHRVQKFVLAGTACSYPKFAPVPFKEEDLWQGYPEETNAPYGVAKRALITMVQAYREQYGFDGVTVIPVNLYGSRDNFDLTTSHVIPALIRKFVEAKERGDPGVVVWGTGQASREFLYVEDAADGIVLALQHYEGSDPVNIGTGEEILIRDLVEEIRGLAGF